MTRTTAEVIHDLDKTVSDHDQSGFMTQTGLVVGFEHEWRIVFRGQPDRLAPLNTMVRDGGIPLGFINVTRMGNDVELLSQPLIEFQNNPETPKMLQALCNGRGKTLAFDNRHT